MFDLEQQLADLRRFVCSNRPSGLQDNILNDSIVPEGLHNDDNSTAGGDGPVVQSANNHFRYIEELLYSRIAVFICLFGIAGNAGNLLVLIPQGRRGSMGRIERFAYWGLVALTLSDAMFCITVVPHAFVDRDPAVPEINFSLLYAVYGDGLINVFKMASTWMTVTLAVGRYLAICHPFRARELIDTTVAKRAVFVVYGACVVFNIPLFLTYRVEFIDCGPVHQLYFRWPGLSHVKRQPSLENAFMWLYFLVGVCLPFIGFVYCNVFLVRALHNTHTRLRHIRAVGARAGHVDQYRPITLTLIVLVVMYVLLVSPCEFALFLRQQLVRRNSQLQVCEIEIMLY